MTDMVGPIESMIRSLLEEAERRGQMTDAERAATDVRGYFGMMDRQLDEFEEAQRTWVQRLQKANEYIPFSPYGAIDRAETVVNWFKGGEDLDLPNIYDLADTISAQIAVLRARLETINSKLDSYLRQPGNPDRLRAVGQAWSQKVQRPISEMTDWFTKDTLLVDNAWGGRSGTNYRNYIVPQHNANAEVATRAKTLLKALDTLASALERFWKELPEILIRAIGELGTLLTSLTTLDPWGVDDAVNKFIQQQLDVIERAYDTINSADHAYHAAGTELTATMNDYTAFPNGHWPISQGLGGITSDPADWTIDSEGR